MAAGNCNMGSFITCSIHQLIKLGRTCWTEHAAHSGEIRNAYKALFKEQVTWRTYIYMGELN
jgi:hypothetical protein